MALLDRISNTNAQVILSLAAMLLAGFLATRVTKKLRLPNVTGYILAGVAIGPWALHVIPDSVMGGMDFVTDVALAFIAFGVGKYFKLSELRKNGLRIIVVTLFESLAAGLLITLVMYFIFHYSLAFALLLAPSAAPRRPLPPS